MIPALAVPKTSFPSSRQFPCGAGSVCGAAEPGPSGVPALLLGLLSGLAVKGGEGAAGCCIWILSGMIPCGDGSRSGGCAALSCPHKEVLYAAWQDPRAVVSYVRRAFCLDCTVASALPLPSACGSLCPWPCSACGQLEESWQAWHVGCFVIAVWCLWGELPPPSAPKTMALPCWEPWGAGQGGLSKDGLSPASPSLCGSSNHGASPPVVTHWNLPALRFTPHITQELLLRSLSSSVFLQGVRWGQGISGSSCHHQKLSPVPRGSLLS